MRITIGYGIGFYGFENENIMKTKEEILKESIKSTLNINEGSPLHDAVMKAMEEYAQQQVKNCSIHDVISRLQKLKRFDLANYRDGEYGIDTEREENDNGDYIDAYEIDVLIKDLTNGL